MYTIIQFIECMTKRNKDGVRMKTYKEMTKEELTALKAELDQQYADARAKGLKLDMSRGKPSVSQLDMVRGMMDVLSSNSDYKSEEGIDCRNYGALEGIREARVLMGKLMGGVPYDQVIVCGNSSLNVMYDMIIRSMVLGVLGEKPWCKLDRVKFLCPVPGYDRHFAITEQMGIEMIPIAMNEQGPDMDEVERYVNNDEAVKGIWCVPKYANPLGISYSDETVRRFAALKPAAKDFRIFWDNAYAVHDLYEDRKDEILDIISECEKAGNPDIVYEFASTSKISFSGSGISAIATSKANLEFIKKAMTIQTIGPDKMNQLRHVRYFKDIDGIREQMKKHADSMRPKFEAVLSCLEEELGALGIGTWVKPNGGYFITFEAMEGCAKAIVAKCKEAGVVLTNAGACFPYGKDPKDSVIRIAPSFPTPEEMAQATELFVLCVKLASVEKLLMDDASK